MDAIEHARELPVYATWKPTYMDPTGLGLGDRQNWHVMPVSVTRDSDTLARVNFQSTVEALKEVDVDECGHEVHRFGHWGPGWFEVILINPDHAECLRVAGEITCALADHPVLDDDAYSEAESEEITEMWENWGQCDFWNHMQRHVVSSDSPAMEWLDENCSLDDVREFHEKFSMCDTSDCIDFTYFKRGKVTRDTVAAWVRTLRNKNK